VLALSLIASGLAGVGAKALRLPGGLLVGAMLAAGFWSIQIEPIVVPSPLRSTIILIAGSLVGMLAGRVELKALRSLAVPAVVSGLALIVAGVGVALLLRVADLSPPADMLATSPGAMTVLTAAAAEHGEGAEFVALFHVTRVAAILLLLPVLLSVGGLNGKAPTDRSAASLPVVSPVRPHGRVTAASLWRVAVLAVIVACGMACGLIAGQVGVSGGLVVGSAFGSGVVSSFVRGQPPDLSFLSSLVQISLGWLVGTGVTYSMLDRAGGMLLAAAISAALLIISGLLVSYLLQAFGHDIPGAVLATSPGAIEVLSVAAGLSSRGGAGDVVVFHSVRMVLLLR
jgi:uncharacterized protein